MLRTLLLLAGILILAGHWLLPPLSANGQFIIFLIGIIFLGIPHGAADLLVANKSAESGKQKFYAFRFFTFYISRLVVFGAVIYFFRQLVFYYFYFLQRIILGRLICTFSIRIR